jgi:hypothetical protein
MRGFIDALIFAAITVLIFITYPIFFNKKDDDDL